MCSNIWIWSEPRFVLATNLSGAESSLLVGGLRLGELYTVSLSCGFGPRQFECGSVAVSTAPPHLVTPAARVYSLAGVARTWAGAEAECVAGGGHLVSLATPGEERRVLDTLGGRDIWTGGNMCPDSPGRREGGNRAAPNHLCCKRSIGFHNCGESA